MPQLQLGRGAELLIMAQNELWRVWVNFNILFQLVPHPLTPRLSSWPRSTALSANINYGVFVLLYNIINKHWKYWCGMVWVGSRCPHVSTCFNSQQRQEQREWLRNAIPLDPLGHCHQRSLSSGWAEVRMILWQLGRKDFQRHQGFVSGVRAAGSRSF